MRCLVRKRAAVGVHEGHKCQQDNLGRVQRVNGNDSCAAPIREARLSDSSSEHPLQVFGLLPLS
jgi:hypothetical protein